MTLHKSQDERRKDILEAARGRFVTDGYTRARLNDVALDAGLSKGGVYFHFKSKREIFDALIDEDFESVMRALKAMRGLTGSVTDRLIGFAQAGFRNSIGNPVVPKFFIVMGEMALAFDDVRARLREMHEAFVTEVRAILVEGVGKGQLRADLDTDTAARLLVTLMDGVRTSVAGDFHNTRQFEKLLAAGGALITEGFLPGAPRLA